MRCEHVRRSGATLHFCFIGKSDQEQTVSATDADVRPLPAKARQVQRGLLHLPGRLPESGYRESNPGSQLGKLPFDLRAHLADLVK